MKRHVLSAGALIGTAAMLGSLWVSGDASAKPKNKEKNKGAKAHSRKDNRDRDNIRHRENVRYRENVRHRDDDDDRRSTPPGWSRGRKTGWGGSDVPPGQAKKRDRDRDDDRFDDRNERRRDRNERRRDRDDRRDRNGSRYTLTGRVVADTDRFSRRITIQTNNGTNQTLTVGRDVPIYRNGARISVHEIREGEVVRVRTARLNSGDVRVIRIDVI
ncbi:MAG: hypothetical protein KY468_20275 [Armatimonadetes bacterium]|nr:hypothetical protein [Armatimonadota bacterium]